MMNKLTELAIKYAKDVVEGKEITTWEVKAQCKIFLNDYNNRQYKEDFEFYYDEKKVTKISKLLKLINFATGFVAGKDVLNNLANFQAFFIANIFGWRYKDKPYKFRYNDNTLFIARKNAKTALIGIVFILLMLTEQMYSEFYSICLTKDLASEIKKAMGQIINASPLISDKFKISATKTGAIHCKLTGSFFEPRVAEAGKNNAIRPCAFVSDEHANFSDNSNFGAMKSGQKNVLNGLVFRTTTAYAINNSIMEEDLDYIRDVLKGTVVNERQFALVYYAEEEHLWDDIGLNQANPLKVEENFNTMKEDRAIALHKPKEREEFLTKTCNKFLQENKGESYLNIEYWKECREKEINFKGKEVIVALDGSISLDLTSVSMMYEENGEYYCMSKGFLPELNLQERREKINYWNYDSLGYCEIQRGQRTVNYTEVENYIRSLEATYGCKIKLIVSDPFNVSKVMESLAEDYNVISNLRQTFTNLTEPTIEFRNAVYSKKVHYLKNELLDWCIANATLHCGKSDGLMIAKDAATKNSKRIDLLATLIFCFKYCFNKNEEIDLNNIIDEDYFM